MMNSSLNHDSSVIKTLPRKGFRFVGTVREEQGPVGMVTDVPVEPTKSTLTLPDKPSIAVLPFANLSGDLEQTYFADGFVEDIITVKVRPYGRGEAVLNGERLNRINAWAMVRRRAKAAGLTTLENGGTLEKAR
jgi:hypothetical protein